MKQRPFRLVAPLVLAAWALLSPLRTAAADDPGVDNAAVVTFAQGDVSLIRDGQPWALFTDNSISVGSTIVTGDDGYAQLEVSDGSSFIVYPNSRVVFRTNPGSIRDLVDLFLGRIKIHIQRIGGQPNPNRVFTPTAVISVRGTTFDVQVDPTEVTTVIVDEGLVTVEHRLLPSRQEVPVGQGESLIVYPEIPLARARVNGVAMARVAEDVARTVASIWDRISRTSRGGGNPSGGGLPGDTPAPPAPLPGDTGAPDPPPPAPPE